MVDLYRQTQAMLCDFLKEKNEQKSERQPFYDFIAADRLPDPCYDIFQAEVLTYPRGSSDQMHRVKQPPRSISD